MDQGDCGRVSRDDKLVRTRLRGIVARVLVMRERVFVWTLRRAASLSAPLHLQDQRFWSQNRTERARNECKDQRGRRVSARKNKMFNQEKKKFWREGATAHDRNPMRKSSGFSSVDSFNQHGDHW